MAVIKKLEINQFRNIENQFIEPSNSVNLVIGKNAHGKTNLLEAIYYIGHNRSFKSTKIGDVVGHKHKSIQLSANVDNKTIKLQKSTKKTLISIDRQKIISTSEITKLLPTQIITPDRGFIVNGSPKNKRSYLDWGVFHVKPELLAVYKSYNKALKNINILLSKNKTSEIDSWFFELSGTAKKINENRVMYIDALRRTTNNQNSLVRPNNNKGFEYSLSTGWPKEVDSLNQSSICEYLNKHLNNFIKTKFLNFGPHKASIKFSLNKTNESLLSRGEQKQYSIIFWLTQVEMLTNKGIRPIILVDDISSELDKAKIEFLFSCLEKLNVQVFVTDIGNNLRPVIYSKQAVYKIHNGVIKQQ
jgi:DNA replication and repair protein RecF